MTAASGSATTTGPANPCVSDAIFSACDLTRCTNSSRCSTDPVRTSTIPAVAGNAPRSGSEKPPSCALSVQQHPLPKHARTIVYKLNPGTKNTSLCHFSVNSCRSIIREESGVIPRPGNPGSEDPKVLAAARICQFCRHPLAGCDARLFTAVTTLQPWSKLCPSGHRYSKRADCLAPPRNQTRLSGICRRAVSAGLYDTNVSSIDKKGFV